MHCTSQQSGSHAVAAHQHGCSAILKRTAAVQYQTPTTQPLSMTLCWCCPPHAQSTPSAGLQCHSEGIMAAAQYQTLTTVSEHGPVLVLSTTCAAARVIQRWVRGWLGRRQAAEARASAITIQRWWKVRCFRGEECTVRPVVKWDTWWPCM
jgi:hypothetical protein